KEEYEVSSYTIKVDGDAVSSSLDQLKSDLEEFEEVLLDLVQTSLLAKDHLKGKSYSKLFESVDHLVEQQREILVFQQIVHEEIENYISEMETAEQGCESNFDVSNKKGCVIMIEIKHNPSKVEEILGKMNEYKSMANQLATTLEQLANDIEDNFSGSASESLISLLNEESEKIKNEKDNWQTLFEQARQVRIKLEEQDRLLITP